MENQKKEEMKAAFQAKVEHHRKMAQVYAKRAKDLDKPYTKEELQKIQIAHGQAIMTLMQDNEELSAVVKTWLDENIKTNTTRKLLGLAIKENAPKTTAKKEQKNG